jgi:all-trans-8'-apo-beta-carotenal 15,15'-oxygenase
MQQLELASSHWQPYDRSEWQRGYTSLKQEYDYWVDEIQGTIPPSLEGTLFRNGPGLLDVNGQPIHHPFDGDGMICAISVKGGRAHFRNRYVRTAGYVAEQEAGKILYRGVFGTQKPGGWLANALDFKLKNIANTNVIYWGGKLLALWEAAEPHSLNPTTLGTIGLEYLEGALSPGSAFSAHPRIDPACELDGGEPCLVNFAVNPGLSSAITMYEFSPTGVLVRRSTHTVPGFSFIHDFVITPHYAIFFQNPVTFNPLPFLAGARSAGECVKFQPGQPTQILVIPRGDKTEQKQGVKRFSVEAGFVFHHANAFEQGEQVIIDSICYADLPSVDPGADFRQVNFEALAPGQFWRFQVNLADGTVQRHQIEERCTEFPSVHPALVGRAYRYAYLAAAHQPIGNAPNQAILKLDVTSDRRWLWSAAPAGYTGEPVFVPRPGATLEDDGWVLVLVYDAKAHRSNLVILDAGDLSLVATLRFKHHIPYGLHGSFTSQVF